MKELASRLEVTIDDFLIKTAPYVAWDNNVPAGRWNNKEIIGHLIDSGHINLQRFIRCTYEENFKLIYYQDEWVAAQHYKTADTAQLLKLWELLNLQIVRVLQYYPANRLQVKCDNGRFQPSFNTVEFIAADYLSHLQHHLSQVN